MDCDVEVILSSNSIRRKLAQILFIFRVYFFKATFSIKYFLRSSYLDKSNYLNYFRQGRI